MTQDDRTAREALNAEAAHWVVRLASESCDAAERRAFEAWRSASPAHELAFERESLAWERTERLRALHRPVVEPVDDAAHAVRAPQYRRLVAAAASVFLALAVVLCLWLVDDATEYVTAVGERRVIQLADGSRLELNTNTRVTVRLADDLRRIELLQGESMFDVFPDAARPFVVAMGDNAVRAVGTAFNIRRDEDSYKVLVTEGVVEASGKATATTPAYQVRLPAGSTATYDAGGVKSHVVSAAEQERVLSWRNGTIALAGETLEQAAAEFNRYNTRQLVVADPAIAGLQLGGYFNAHDLDGFVKVLVAAFALEAELSDTQVLLKGTPRTTPLPADNGAVPVL